MDSGSPEQLPPQLAIQAIAIVSAIFVVLFALWADYFGYYAEKAAGLHPDEADEAEQQLARRARGSTHPYDPLRARDENLTRVRAAGLTTLMFQALLYLGAGEVRAEYPLTANLIFLAAIIAQGYVQAVLETRVQRLAKSFAQALSEAESARSELASRERMGQAWRAFAWSLVAGATHLSVFMGTMLAFFAGGQALALSRPTMAGVVLLGTLCALLASLASTFLLAPFQLRRALPCTPLEAGETRTQIEADFRAAGLASPHIWILETGRDRTANAMISGFAKGRGIFRPGLFLTRSFVSQLEPDQIRAIVRHEISHCALHHLRARMLFSSFIVVGVLTFTVAVVVAVHALAPDSAPSSWIAPISGFAAFGTFVGLIGRQMRRHELEADRHSVTDLGNDPAVLADSLAKLDAVNRREITQESATHPSTASRIAILREIAMTRAASPSQATADSSQDRAA